MSLLDTLDVITVVSKRIGDVPFAVAIEETYTDELQITSHPVETGTNMADHAFKEQPEVILKCGWSNADYAALLAFAKAGADSFHTIAAAGFKSFGSTLASEAKSFGQGAVAKFDPFGAMTSSNYIDAVYSRLLKLQASRQLFDIVTSRRKYQNVLLRSLVVKNDPKTSASLMLTAVCRQIHVVKTKATTLPPRDDQGDPARTAEVSNLGVKHARPAMPSPGGAVPPR